MLCHPSYFNTNVSSPSMRMLWIRIQIEEKKKETCSGKETTWEVCLSGYFRSLSSVPRRGFESAKTLLSGDSAAVEFEARLREQSAQLHLGQLLFSLFHLWEEQLFCLETFVHFNVLRCLDEPTKILRDFAQILENKGYVFWTISLTYFFHFS